MSETDVREHFHVQAAGCDALGSPFYARFIRACGELLSRETAVERHVLSWPGQPRSDALALRFVATLRFLALRGDRSLQVLFDPEKPIALTPREWTTIQHSLTCSETEALSLLALPVQTNEVGRCFALQAAFRYLHDSKHLPLALYEVGASAGLNMLWDRYHYQTARWWWGDRNARVRLESEWSGSEPGSAHLEVLSRRGCDISPLDVHQSEHQLRLLSYIWPDQRERLIRTRAAIETFARSDLRVERGEASSWLEENLTSGEPGVFHVVYQSVMMQYLSHTQRQQLVSLMQKTGAASSTRAPLAWVTLEPTARGAWAELSVTLWPKEQRYTLAEADYQGRWVKWHPSLYEFSS